MKGTTPTSVPCGYCHKDVVNFDAVWESSVPYHEHCWKISLGNELRKYDKKMQLGSLTVAEANFTKDIQFLSDVARQLQKITNKPHKSEKFLSKTGGDLVTRPTQRELCKASNLEVHFKQLEETRSERWAWEIFNLLENQKLLTECEPTFPLETIENLGRVKRTSADSDFKIA